MPPRSAAPAAAGAEAQPAFALWNLGFRPFYLGASVFASVSILLWIAEYAGLVHVGYLRDPVWHAHEMLFGYTIAVIVGFLFTAGRNWTGQPTPSGALLAGYFLLWIAGRVSVLTPYPVIAAVVNAAFPVAAAIGLAVPLARSANRRNYFFVALLVLLGALTLAIHLARLGLDLLPQRASLQVGLDIVLFVIAVMGGRVIPMFTNNGVPGAAAVRHAHLEKLALGLVIALTVVDGLQLGAAATLVVAACAAIAHASRWWLWQPWKTRSTPLVWVLHLAYLWIPVHLLLRVLAEWGVVAPTYAVHALTVGAIGGLIIGMVTRTAKGHTGRPLRADAVDTACYVLVLLSAAVRVAGPLLAPTYTLDAVIASSLLWSAGFGLYAVRYFPVLTRARVDGKPG